MKPAIICGPVTRAFATTLLLASTAGTSAGCATVATPSAQIPSPPASSEPAADDGSSPGDAAVGPQAGSTDSSSRGEPPRKNYWLPVVEIVAMDALINRAARVMISPEHFDISVTSIRRNLDGPWVVDEDPFSINQALHPYQGAMYHGIARSSGLDYWQSAAYTLAGSALWEIAGETTPPSVNDQIASGIAGSFLGEPLFRAAHMLLDRRLRRPGAWRVLAATLLSPPVGVNRLIVDDRVDPSMTDVLGASDIRVQIGVIAPVTSRVRSWSALEPNTRLIGFSMDYGFPGRSDYCFGHPFDYFRIDGITSRDGLESLATRGLIAGHDYQAGAANRGVWGLYGSYDYFAPDVFRVSSTALSIGSTAQSRLSTALTLQGTGLFGVGYTATQAVARSDGREYHYGVAPQALASVRLIAGRRAAVDITAREFYVTDVAGFGERQRDVILRADASVALRLFGRHAIAVSYFLSRRDTRPPDRSRAISSRTTIGAFYTFLGSGGFGAVR
jgi:hypothetical protein